MTRYSSAELSNELSDDPASSESTNSTDGTFIKGPKVDEEYIGPRNDRQESEASQSDGTLIVYQGIPEAAAAENSEDGHRESEASQSDGTLIVYQGMSEAAAAEKSENRRSESRMSDKMKRLSLNPLVDIKNLDQHFASIFDSTDQPPIKLSKYPTSDVGAWAFESLASPDDGGLGSKILPPQGDDVSDEEYFIQLLDKMSPKERTIYDQLSQSTLGKDQTSWSLPNSPTNGDVSEMNTLKEIIRYFCRFLFQVFNPREDDQLSFANPNSSDLKKSNLHQRLLSMYVLVHDMFELYFSDAKPDAEDYKDRVERLKKFTVVELDRTKRTSDSIQKAKIKIKGVLDQLVKDKSDQRPEVEDCKHLLEWKLTEMRCPEYTKDNLTRYVALVLIADKATKMINGMAYKKIQERHMVIYLLVLAELTFRMRRNSTDDF